MRAHDGIRTRDLFLTKEVLYRLSYVSLTPRRGPSRPDIHAAPAGAVPPGPQIFRRSAQERATRLELATLSLEG